MARARQDKPHRTAKELRSVEDRLRGRDVILACREIVDRDLHLFEVERLARELHLAARQLVLEIAVAQIERMVGRHARRVRVPYGRSNGGLAMK
jgi:hypothetical protein